MPSVEEIFAARDGASAPEPTAAEEQKPDLQFDYSDDEGSEEKLAEREANLKFPAPGQREESEEEKKQVPIAALHEARRKYTYEVADVRKQNGELIRQLTELTQLVQRNQQPQQEQPKPPEFDWDNPVASAEQVARRVMAEERSRIDAYLAQERQRAQADREARETVDAISRHGEEVVTAAFKAFAAERGQDPAWESNYQRIMNSPNQYEALVRWHKAQQARTIVGDDVEAFIQRIKAERDEELRTGVAAPVQRSEARLPPERRPAMPTDMSRVRNVGSRNGAAWEGPPSLKDILANR
jgi:hypothetical protein